MTPAAEMGTASAEARVRARSGVAEGVLAVLFVAYVAGLLLWLVIGLIPSLAQASGSLHSALVDQAHGSGPLATFSRRVLVHGMTQSGWDVAVQYLFSALNVALALLLACLRWHERVPRLLAFALLGTAATFNEPSHQVFHITGEPLAIKVLHLTFHVVSGVAYAWAVVLFPDGHLPFPGLARHRWWLRGALAGLTVAVTLICWHSSFVPHRPFFVLFFGILVPAVGFAAQTARLRRPAGRSAQDLAQSRLLRTALVPAMVTAALWLLATAAGVFGGSIEAHADVWANQLQNAFPAVFAVVPVALLVGILRYRLFQIDTLASRTFLYGLLAGFVTVAYALLVTVTGALVGSGAWAAVLAMTLVALAVEPARVGLHGVANRLVFGQQLSPAEALRSLADGLERLGPADELRELCRVVVTGTRAAASARVLLLVDGAPLEVARYPADAPDDAPADRSVPIGDAGAIELKLHRGLRLRAHEERLLQDLASHAVLMVRNARLAAELARQVERVTEQAAELQRSRAGVVTAQDAERVKLERDLHDGAQQELIAVLVGLGPAAAVAAADPAGGARELDELEALLASTSQTMRELCDGDLPAPLRDGGIGPALQPALAAAGRAGLDATLELDLAGRPPLDVEAAVYYCCQEALQNAAKHARAGRVWIAVSVDGGELGFSVRDDGAGFDPAVAAASSGLANMSARLAVLGGWVAVDSEPGVGTRVHGQVPAAVLCVSVEAEARPLSPAVVRGAILGTGVLLTALAVTSAATALTRAADGAWLRPPLWALAVAPLAVVLLLPSVRRGSDRLSARVLHGEDPEAYTRMAAFSSRIANTLAVDDVLPRLAEAAARTVRGEQAEVQLVLDEGRRWRQVWPPDAGALETDVEVEVRHGGAAVGAIGVEAAAGLRASDLRLLDELARPAGLALSTVRLTFELRRRLAEVEAGNAELRASRDRIVAARRDERERLRGDVEAQIAPPLERAREALRRARAGLGHGSADLAPDLAEARAGSGEALEALRRLSRGIVPPELHDIGPGAALELWASEVGARVEVHVTGELRHLREEGAIEAALFFCCARAVAALGGGVVEVGSGEACSWLVVLHAGTVDAALETLLRDRVEALGGTVTLGPGRIEARLPRTAESQRTARPDWAREASL